MSPRMAGHRQRRDARARSVPEDAASGTMPHDAHARTAEPLGTPRRWRSAPSVSGLLAYVFFALVTRGLGAEPAAPVAVLWACWGFAGRGADLPAAALDRPVGQPSTTEGGRSAAALARRGPGFVVAVGVVRRAARRGWRGSRSSAPRAAPSRCWSWRSRLRSGRDGSRPRAAGRPARGSARWRAAWSRRTRCAASAAVALTSRRRGTRGVRRRAARRVRRLPVLALDAPARRTGGGPATTRRCRFVSGASVASCSARPCSPAGRSCWRWPAGRRREVTALFAALALFRAPYTLALGLVSALTGPAHRPGGLRAGASALRRVPRRRGGRRPCWPPGSAAGVGALAGPAAAWAGLRRRTSGSPGALTLRGRRRHASSRWPTWS